ncbi:MAG TPA: type II toxin-antitoxin system VapB family antitoxin [Caulobacteraceae bacterium]|nr:type II toxin-antitoxin system VapB family antitoxin [Caulobacteraceae bacterium]
MGIFIKNPDVERKARELAALRGKTITAAIEDGLDHELGIERAKRRRPTLAEMQAATDEFRRKTGLDKVKLGATRADFDALWESPDVEAGFDPK